MKLSVNTTLTDNQVSTIATLQVKLNSLGVEGFFQPTVIEGPIVTLYKFVPKGATRVSLVERLAPDLAIALGSEAVQVKRIPGESAIGIFVPNKDRKILSFLEIINEVWKESHNGAKYLPIPLGIDFQGNNIIEDLTSLPHLLIAGSTGSGKSTLLNCIITSLIYCLSSNHVKLVLSDTKQVEFGHYIGAPHLLFNPAQTIYQTLEQLDWVNEEIMDRLGRIGKAGFRNIRDYNEGKSFSQGQRMPFIVVVIDELADLLTSRSKNENEKVSIGKLAESKIGTIVQKARASGVHMVAAVQRPSVKVVEGNIKSNFPARISFRLPSEADSRTVLGQSGAEQLLTQGDMFYLSPNYAALRRIHAPYTRIEDIKAAVDAACQREA